MRGAYIAFFALLLASSVQQLAAAEDLDSILGGFEEVSNFTASDDQGDSDFEVAAQTSAGDLTGSLLVNASYNYEDHYSSTGTDYQGLSKLRTQINLQYDYDFSKNWETRVSAYAFYDWVYKIHDDRDYTDQVLDEYQSEAEFKELWIRGQLREDTDLKIGRQVVNWGRSETLRVLDLLNPLDNRELGLADIENLRLPVFMVKGDYYFSQWNLSLIAIPETRFSKHPPYGSDFYPAAIDLEEKEPTDISDTSWAARLIGIFSGWDISFHAARLWQNEPHLVPLVTGTAFAELQHSRINMLGSGGNYSTGSWMFKAELAYLTDIDYTISTPSPFGDLPSGTVEKDRVDLLLAFEYYGITNTVLSVDVVNRHIVDYQDNMEPNFYVERDQLETSFRYDTTFINERLAVTALAVVFGERGQYGAIIRLAADYELMDALNVSGGVLSYQEGDPPPFDRIDKNDRIFGEVKWSF
jgi:hypothetical protein